MKLPPPKFVCSTQISGEPMTNSFVQHLSEPPAACRSISSVRYDPERGSRGSWVVGQSAGCDIVIDLPTVSRFHCRLDTTPLATDCSSLTVVHATAHLLTVRELKCSSEDRSSTPSSRWASRLPYRGQRSSSTSEPAAAESSRSVELTQTTSVLDDPTVSSFHGTSDRSMRTTRSSRIWPPPTGASSGAGRTARHVRAHSGCGDGFLRPEERGWPADSGRKRQGDQRREA